MMNTLLHVGCGTNRKEHTTAGFNQESWRELRLDINPAVQPDLIGSMLDMSAVPDASVDAVFSSHSIEHLYAHEVPVALTEFLRVLKPEGFAVITCPDLQSICELVAEDKLLEPAYHSPAGGIAPVDVLFGYRPSLAAGNTWMAHKCGFTRSVLLQTLVDCGFARVTVMSRGRGIFDLWAIASKSWREEQAMKDLAQLHFPLTGQL